MESTVVSPATVLRETCLADANISVQTQKLLLEASGITLVCIIPALSLWTAFSNMIIIIAIFIYNSNQTPSTWILCSQGFSDFITGASVMPLLLGMVMELLISLQTGCDLQYIPHVFQPYLYFHRVSTLGAVCNFAISSVDRYYAVSRPFRYRAAVKVKHVQRFLAAFWISLFALEAMFYRVSNVNLVVLVLGILITIVFQILVFKAFHQHNATTAENLRQASVSEQALKQEKTMAKRIGLLIATLCCCTLPMLLVFVVLAVLGQFDTWHTLLGPWVTLIFYANSALNPFLYCWRNKNVKGAVKKLFRIN